MSIFDEIERDAKAGMPKCQECGEPVKRKVRKYCSHKCKGAARGRALRKPEMWRAPNKRGYIDGTVWLEDGTQRIVKQHRWVMEKHLGYSLSADDDVHHINGIRHDNRIENLMVIDHAEHTRMHSIGNSYARGKKFKITTEDAKRRAKQCTDMRKRKVALGMSEKW